MIETRNMILSFIFQVISKKIIKNNKKIINNNKKDMNKISMHKQVY